MNKYQYTDIINEMVNNIQYNYTIKLEQRVQLIGYTIFKLTMVQYIYIYYGTAMLNIRVCDYYI